MEKKNELALNRHQKSLSVTRIEKSFNSIKLRDINDDVEIRKMVLRLFVLTALKKENYPDGIERDFLIQFIKQNFKGFTVDEIVFAFELAVKRELLPYMSRNDDVKHYQNFSPDYFSSIMYGFKKYKAQIIIKNNIKKEISSNKFYKEVDSKEWFEKNLFSKYIEYLNGGEYKWNETMESYLFEVLERMEVIKLTIDEKKDIKHDVISNFNFKKNKRHTSDIQIKNKCKSKCFKLWIEEQIFNDVDISKIILSKIDKF